MTKALPPSMSTRLIGICALCAALAACSPRRGEGDGFSNAGAYQAPLCRERTPQGERWFPRRGAKCPSE